jgi:F0F1-type ATP synthase membrane subunit a
MATSGDLRATHTRLSLLVQFLGTKFKTKRQTRTMSLKRFPTGDQHAYLVVVVPLMQGVDFLARPIRSGSRCWGWMVDL